MRGKTFIRGIYDFWIILNLIYGNFVDVWKDSSSDINCTIGIYDYPNNIPQTLFKTRIKWFS